MRKKIDESTSIETLLILVQIGRFKSYPGFIPVSVFDHVVERYFRELKRIAYFRQGVFASLSRDTTRETEWAIDLAKKLGILDHGKSSTGRIPIVNSPDLLLKHQQSKLEDTTILFAKEAAEKAHHAYCWDELDKDLEEKHTAAS
jgi:hypothetical protein